jgi:serum/glucocorticoid-regulated kinase 2
VGASAKDLIHKLLNRNPRKRLGTFGDAEEIKKHPFFKDIDWNKVFRKE